MVKKEQNKIIQIANWAVGLSGAYVMYRYVLGPFFDKQDAKVEATDVLPIKDYAPPVPIPEPTVIPIYIEYPDPVEYPDPDPEPDPVEYNPTPPTYSSLPAQASNSGTSVMAGFLADIIANLSMGEDMTRHYTMQDVLNNEAYPVRETQSNKSNCNWKPEQEIFQDTNELVFY